jgi:hypothetical protein
MLCPRCGIRTDDASAAGAPAVLADDQPSSTGGLLIGLLLAQGLYYGLRHLAAAWLLYSGDPAGEVEFWDHSLPGLVTLQAIQALSLLVGGMIATAGRRHGVAVGAILGVLNALLLILLQKAFHQSADDFTAFVQPVIHAFVGAVGGTIGSRVWQPRPELPPMTGDGRTGSAELTTVIPEQSVEPEHEAWPWAYIVLGVAIAVGGTLGAGLIRDFVVLAGGGKGREMQSQFITWEISLLAQVIGGAFAGAGTRGSGLYGFWVGAATAVVLGVIQSLAPLRIATQAAPGWLTSGAAEGASGLVVQTIQAVLLGTVGGWLGSLVLPHDPGRPNRPGR